MARKCFYSFHYKPDNWRAAQVRNIGAIEGNAPASDNDWESISGGADPDQKIKNWIAAQMSGRTCAIVLVGTNTAKRKWIDYEIIKAWTDGLGIVGLRIHGLKDRVSATSQPGLNPFEHLTYSPNKQPLSAIVKTYSPVGDDSKAKYDWITTYLEAIVEEAVKIRQAF